MGAGQELLIKDFFGSADAMKQSFSENGCVWMGPRRGREQDGAVHLK